MQIVLDPTFILAIIIYAIFAGAISSMIGIGGGALNTPLLIILFLISPREASATTLAAALFVAVSSSISYHRQNPRPTVYKAGLFLALTTIPGALTGVMLREMITDDQLLRIVFAIILFPVALKMLQARRRGKTDMASEIHSFRFEDIEPNRLVIALAAAFSGGVVAGLLGLGGGVVIVPVLSFLMGFPMHAAVATSMFTMIFTTASGTMMNFYAGQINLAYGAALGIGMLIGAQFGARLACRVDAARLKQFFGLVIMLPIVKMARLGQLWLAPSGTNFLLATIGDIIIWFVIVVPIAIIKFVILRRENQGEEPSESNESSS